MELWIYLYIIFSVASIICLAYKLQKNSSCEKKFDELSESIDTLQDQLLAIENRFAAQLTELKETQNSNYSNHQCSLIKLGKSVAAMKNKMLGIKPIERKIVK